MLLTLILTCGYFLESSESSGDIKRNLDSETKIMELMPRIAASYAERNAAYSKSILFPERR